VEWAGHVAYIGEKRNAQMILVGKYEGKRILGSPSRRREDNIKIFFLNRIKAWTGFI
jgi:hypothetical protein